MTIHSRRLSTEKHDIRNTALLKNHKNCRFVNDVLQIGERKKNVLGRLPVERSHREIVVLSLSDSELLFKVCKVKELMTSIKLLVIFSVTAFYFSIMLRCKGFNQFMPNTELCQSIFKQGWNWIFTIG